MAKIFISYRRSNLSTVDHLHDKLSSAFKNESLFWDKESIESGKPFPSEIRNAVKNAFIVLVIIDKEWIKVQDESTYKQRIMNPKDWVRQEIQLALFNKKKLIPILINGASMPTKEQLPEDLAALSDLNGISLSIDHFREDAQKLVDTIKKLLIENELANLLKGEENHYPPAANFRPRELDELELEEMMKEIPYWKLEKSELIDDTRFDSGYIRIEIVRNFQFPSFIDAVEFMRIAAKSIDALQHHPRWQNVFRTITVRYSTFDIGHRVSDRDLKSALMLEKLYREFIESISNKV